MTQRHAPVVDASATPSLQRAALWMGGWLTLMVVIAVAGREAQHELTVFQIMLMRSGIGLVMLHPLVRAAGGYRALAGGRLGRHVLRNAVHYGAQYAWFAALALIPLAQLVAIEFTMPLWTALLAAAFLGERLTAWKVVALVLGLAGVTVIVRPVAGSIGVGQWIALAAAVGFAVSVTLTKSLTRTDGAVRIMFWMLVVQTILGLVPALAVWRWPSTLVWGWIVVIAFCGTFSHYCMARALRHAEATAVVPIDFVRVPLTALAGWLVYDERVDALTLVGAALIIAGNALNLLRLRRRGTIAPPDSTTSAASPRGSTAP